MVGESGNGTKAVYYAKLFEVKKCALFTKGKKTQSCAVHNGAVSSYSGVLFLKLLFDTATLIILSLLILSLRMLQTEVQICSII